jgi:hypothetical protein
LAWTPVVCLALAVLSIWLQGFQFGVDNNVFHLPIVLRWYDLPQFADDPVMQSLRRYATPVFPALGLISNEHNISAVFRVAHLATRTLTFLALAEIGGAVGLAGLRRLALLGALALSSVVYGNSAIGRDELLVNLFTHTALAQAVGLFSIAALVRGRPIQAGIAAGLALDLNVMVGVWLAVPFAAVALTDLVRRRAPLRRLILAGIAFGLAGAPVVAWILWTQRFGPTGFDYRAYLVDYYPFHFFIGWSPWAQRIALALQVVGGLAATRLLPANRTSAAVALIAFSGLFLAGAAVDQVTHSRFILNLHLLRVDAMIAWMAALLMAAATVDALFGRRWLSAPGAGATLCGLVIGQWWLAAAGIAAMAAADWLGRRAHAAPRVGVQRPMPDAAALVATAAIVVLSVCVGGAYSAMPPPAAPGAPPTDAQLAGWRPIAPDWVAVANWARSATPSSATFLVPWKLDFTAVAQRRSWVGWKDGATAMWAPETYAAWRQRGAQVRALADAPAELAYACRQGIDYVILDKRPGHALPGADAAFPAAYANRWFSVIKPQGCAAL